jgi:hypothetical protein
MRRQSARDLLQIGLDGPGEEHDEHHRRYQAVPTTRTEDKCQS